jgi:hypothetical protein
MKNARERIMSGCFSVLMAFRCCSPQAFFFSEGAGLSACGSDATAPFALDYLSV